MDYKYIEQLLERYWQCESTLEEEDILRAFFSQKDIPAELAGQGAMFVYGSRSKKTDVLREDFDERIMAMIGNGETVKAKKTSLRASLQPLFKAAAIVAIVVTIGNAAQFSFSNNEAMEEPNVAADYKKAYTTDNPSVAYENTPMPMDTLLNNVNNTTGEPVNLK